MSQKEPETYSYREGLEEVTAWVWEHAHQLLGIIVNGSGPDVGKTTFIGDLVARLRGEGVETVDYSDDVEMLDEKVDVAPNPVEVVVKQTQQGFGMKDRGEKMQQMMVNSFIGEIIQVLGKAPDQHLFVNLDADHHPFPSDAVPSDMHIRNERASKKPR